MKKTFLVLATAGLAACGGGMDAVKTQDATAFFRPHLEKVYAAWATLDPTKPAQYYAKDTDLVFFDLAPLKYKGWPEYEDGFKKVAAEWKSIKILLGSDFKASQNGNLAWTTCTFTFEIEPKSGIPMKGEARATEILEKRGNEWLIIHEHVSAPFPEAPPPPAERKK